jgi:hypothetical protein
MDRNRANHFSVAASIIGAIGLDDLKAALVKLQLRHPVLRAAISEASGSEIAFRFSSDTVIPLTVVERTTAHQWREEIANQGSIPFNTQAAPLFRVTMIHGEEQSDIVLTIHHSVTDGMGLFYLLRDLIGVLSGEELQLLPIAPSIEQLRLDTMLVDPIPEQLSQPPGPSMPYRLAHDNQAQIDSLSLTTDETTRIVAVCRQKGVTVHSALTAALVLAGQAENREWGTGPVRVFTPINIRRSHGIGESLTVALGAGVIKISSGATRDVWDVARGAMADLAYFRLPDNEFAISTCWDMQPPIQQRRQRSRLSSVTTLSSPVPVLSISNFRTNGCE